MDEVYEVSMPVQANLSTHHYASVLEEDRILKRVIQRVKDDPEERSRMDKRELGYISSTLFIT